MDSLILVLLVLAAILYVLSGASRFFRFQIMGHDPAVWWRGSMGLLGFSIALMIWQIMQSAR
jgi:phosphatidylserine synthase